MPQELHVVSCYRCHMFQVDIIKKVTRWTCKMCGEKQSLIKVYAKGSGRECREVAQNLNKKLITLNEKLGYVESDSECETNDNPPEVASGGHVNKWSEFLSTENNIEDDLDNNSNNGRHVSKISTFNSRINRSDTDDNPVGVYSSSRNKWSEFLNEENKKCDYNNINNDDYYNYDVPCKKRKICKDSVGSVENTDYKCNILTQRSDDDNGNKWNVYLDQKPCQVYEKENRITFPVINNTNVKDVIEKSNTIPNIFADNEEDIDSMLDI